MAVVAQESLLFDTTLRENIRFGRLDATDAEIEEAARKAEIHAAIIAMPRGYDTPAGDRGSSLSGGQRQRIAIARAVLRDPRLLVLDEATSALDPSTEEAVTKTLEKLRKGRTIVSVTHRLATVLDFDRICVMQDGSLIESGTHEALLRKGGLYKQLWLKQNGVQVSEDGAEALISPELLETVPLFSSLDASTRKDLASRFATMRYAQAHVLFRAGDPGDAFYVVARGQVALEIPPPNGVKASRGHVAVASEGDCFGEIALLQGRPRTATARMKTPCTLLVLARQHFADLIAKQPVLTAQLRGKATAHLASDERE